MSQEQQKGCNLCCRSLQPLTSLIQNSLYAKYSQNMYSTRDVDDILQENLSANFVRFQDFNYFDHDEELLRREYGEHEFGHKIEMLSEYYKFHRDIPTWNDRNIEGIMGKYYSRVKDVDYKKIKKVLKQEQGVSLTTQRNESSFEGTEGTEYTRKSRYSTMLDNLQKSNESMKLMDIFMKMEDGLKKIKNQNDFKGQFVSCRKFQDYLNKQKKRKYSNVENSEQNRKGRGFEKLKPKKKKSKKAHNIIGIRQIIFASNQSIKDKKYETIKNAVSNSKTTATDTISREEMTKRQKSRSSQLPTGRQLPSSRNYENKHIANELMSTKLKPLNQFNVASIIKKFKPKQIKQIYDPFQKQTKDIKILKQLRKKSSSKLLKTRSKSQRVIPTNHQLSKNASKKEINPCLNPQRNVSCKSFTKSSKFATIEVDNLQDQQKGLLSFRQNSKKISRSNSTGKISCCKSKQYQTYTFEDRKESKKTIDNILQTKLMGMKKKPILI